MALRWPTGLADVFLKRGGDVNHRDSFGRTPLHVASSVNAPDMVKWLIANGGLLTRFFYEKVVYKKVLLDWPKLLSFST